MRLPWLAHDEAPGPYITIPQYRFNKTKQHTRVCVDIYNGIFKVPAWWGFGYTFWAEGLFVFLLRLPHR